MCEVGVEGGRRRRVLDLVLLLRLIVDGAELKFEPRKQGGGRDRGDDRPA